MTTQHRNPNPRTVDGPGWCLRFTQSVYGLTGAPFWHPSAWAAWLATEYKHTTRTMPNASVPVWFSHFGTYGDPPTYGNWGHVVAYIPGRGFLSSPAWVRPGQTVGQLWLDSIEAVERTFNAKFVGWSEDLNGTRIISGVGGAGSGSTGEEEMTPEQMKELKRYIDARTRSAAGSHAQIILSTDGHWLDIGTGRVGIWGRDLEPIRDAIIALNWQRRDGAGPKGKDDLAYADGGPGPTDYYIFDQYRRAAVEGRRITAPISKPKGGAKSGAAALAVAPGLSSEPPELT